MSSTVTVSSMLGNISNFAYNPAAIQRFAIATYGAINDGTVSIVDATNPFVFSLENASVNTSAFMQAAAALTRRQYPAAATSVSDLYLHMSDTDFANIFALPSVANFTLMINEAQLLSKLVYNVNTNESSLTIPRNSVFYASGVPFSIQYPINITQLQHGGLIITYDTSNTSPLQTLPTNAISYTTVMDAEYNNYIVFSVATQQFDIVELTNNVNSTGGFTTVVPYTQQYYYCRVYCNNNGSSWTEMQTAYNQEVYDVSTPTAVVSVGTSSVTVNIPVIYITTGQVSGNVRVDVYETQGPLTQILGNYTLDNFTATFKALDPNDITPEVAAFTAISGIAVYSTDTTTGGRNALTFSELQMRVINNSVGPRNLPITPSQIQSTLLDMGYTLVKNIDTITNRIYWATKPLPMPTSHNLVTPANASVLTLITTTATASNYYGCITHSTGSTITPAALFQVGNGITKLVSTVSYNALKALGLAELAYSINVGNYFFTPFYYVLDTTDANTFGVRPYYLNSPVIHGCSFVGTNSSTALQVSVAGGYSILPTATGYQIKVTTNSNSTYQALPDSQVYCQLAFKCSAQNGYSYMNGTQLARNNNSGERTYVFNISTNYDINSSDQIVLSSFVNANITGAPRGGLTQDISILFTTSNATAMTAPRTSIDTVVGTALFGTAVIGITQQTLNVQFGYPLPTLWNSYRTIAGSVQYQTYPADVPSVYTKNVYNVDPVTSSAFTVVAGVLTYNVLHHTGDAVLDSNGHQIYTHRAGDTVLDSNGLPIPVSGYQTLLNRSLDIVVLDGIYQFANDPITLNYLSQIDTSLITTLTEDLVMLSSEVLENTEIYYYPALAKGTVAAIVDGSTVVNMEAAQALKVELFVTNTVYNNASLLAQLQSSTIQVVGTYLSANETVAVSAMEDALSSTYGTDVLGVSLSGLGGSNNYSVVTLTDSSSTLSINKVLALQPNGQLAVVEDISIVFTVHSATSF